MLKKLFLARFLFLGPIVPLVSRVAIGPPIFSPMHEMYIHQREESVFEVPHRLKIRQFHNIYEIQILPYKLILWDYCNF